MNKKIVISIKIIISGLLLWFLAHTSKLDFSLLTHLIYSPVWLLSTVIIYCIAIAISSWRWYKLNNAQGIRLHYLQTILPTYLGIAFNNLLPGGVGGDFFRYYFINKHIPTKKSVVMLSIFCDRITGLMGIFIAVALFSLLNIKYFHENNMTLYFLFLSLILSCSLIVLYAVSKYLPKQMGISHWLNKTFGHRLWIKPLLSLLDAIRIYRNSSTTIIECLAASVAIQILIAITCMMIAHMMNFAPLPLSDYIMAIAITQIVNLIPIAPGGFGMGEIAFANVLLLLNPGTSASYATIFLAYRLIGLLTYLPGISVFVFEKHHLKSSAVASNEIHHTPQ
jgi:uncharacterized protein (TIRG00374 family)